MTRFIFTALLIFIIWAESALAADPFTVANVPVDATADTAIDAQLKATEDGQLRAAQRLIERLTLDQERAERGLPEITIDTARAMIRGQSIGNEKRSASRYLGDITVAFNPSRVQSFIDQSGLTMITTQSRESLVLPILNGQSPWANNGWTQAWQRGGFTHALTPIKVAPMDMDRAGLVTAREAVSGNKAALSETAKRLGVEQILIAEASGAPGNVTVTLSDFAIFSGERRRLGSVTAGSFDFAAARAVDKLETDWKRASVTLAQNATSAVVTVLYNSQNEWIELQEAINSSAQIQDARLDALSKDGAMMTLTFGDMGRLSNELAYKGVQIKTDPEIGTFLARSNYRRR